MKLFTISSSFFESSQKQEKDIIIFFFSRDFIQWLLPHCADKYSLSTLSNKIQASVRKEGNWNDDVFVWACCSLALTLFFSVSSFPYDWEAGTHTTIETKLHLAYHVVCVQTVCDSLIQLHSHLLASPFPLNQQNDEIVFEDFSRMIEVSKRQAIIERERGRELSNFFAYFCGSSCQCFLFSKEEES